MHDNILIKMYYVIRKNNVAKVNAQLKNNTKYGNFSFVKFI